MICDLEHEIKSRGYTLSLYVAFCRIEYLHVFNTDEHEEFNFLLHLCVHLVWQRSFDIGWLLPILFPFWSFFWSIFSTEVHLPSHSPQCSALHFLSGNNLVTLWLLLFFFYVIDPFRSMQVCAWCSFYWLSDWQKLFKVFFLFFY